MLPDFPVLTPNKAHLLDYQPQRGLCLVQPGVISDLILPFEIVASVHSHPEGCAIE
ncbi:hypothetical protein STEG23_018408, partial [Scotinomys teguina]